MSFTEVRWDGRCQRCYHEVGGYIMSFFNTQLICLDCDERERAHPRYKEAKDAEHAALRSGNYNFPGIGLPEDLR